MIVEGDIAYSWGKNWFGVMNYITGQRLFEKRYQGPFWVGSDPIGIPVIKDSIVYVANHNSGNFWTSLMHIIK